MCADVKNFYLNTLLDRPEYMQLALTIIPQEIIDKYKLMDKEKNGKVYIIIDKGMYGLPQAGRLANNLLVTTVTPWITPMQTYTWLMAACHKTSHLHTRRR
jgi:hypothetical protein